MRIAANLSETAVKLREVIVAHLVFALGMFSHPGMLFYFKVLI